MASNMSDTSCFLPFFLAMPSCSKISEINLSKILWSETKQALEKENKRSVHICSFHTFYLHILHTPHISFAAFAIYYCNSQHQCFLGHPTLECPDFCSSSLYSASPPLSNLPSITSEWPPGLASASVDGALEDEFDVALLPCQPGATERAGSVEGMGAVG